VITEATSPYRIQYASQNWCELFGHDPFKIQGQSCKLLQGNDTEVDRLTELMTGVKVCNIYTDLFSHDVQHNLMHAHVYLKIIVII
jgi:hypothetical protein